MSEPILDAIILSDTPPTEDQLRQIVDEYIRLGTRTELAQLDFKVNFDGSTKDWCELLKDAVSMSNAGGGLIIFGVDNRESYTHEHLEGILPHASSIWTRW
jgi:hypothetical protein